jgi:ABC-2 type transport system ATP-binding protein
MVADAGPDELRTQGSLTKIRYPLPSGAPTADLPAVLAADVDPDHGELVVHTTEVTATLDALVGWAERHRIELDGLEVGPPSLEDAYLTLSNQLSGGPPAEQEVRSHA